MDSSLYTHLNFLIGRDILEEPIEEGEWETFKMAKRMYKSCMNETLKEDLGLKPTQMILDQIGGWPAAEGKEEVKEDWKW